MASGPVDVDGGVREHRGRMDPSAGWSLESLLAATTTVAYARFGRDGILRQANPRFLDVCAARVGVSSLVDLVIEGQRQEMGRLLRRDDSSGGQPLVHLAGGVRAPTTLRATWGWDGDELVLLGEPPVADLEATQAALVRLNGRVSELARENAKKSAQLERALDDLRQAQAALVHREKMAALGQVTAGVAHELNNPLAYVKNNLFLVGEGVDDLLGLVNLLGDGLDSIEVAQPELYEAVMDRIEAVDLPSLGERLPDLVRSVDKGVDRAAQLVNSLRTFSRLDEAEVKTIDLNDSLRSVVEFAGFLVQETGTDLTTDLGELPPVTCSPGQLNQAVLNILTNAIQSSAPGGKVSLTSRLVADEVVVSVLDNGPGVPAEIAERIFDPFFTTRPVGSGTGLGLSIAHTIVAAQGGRIVLERGSGPGAVFRVHLPLPSGGPP